MAERAFESSKFFSEHIVTPNLDAFRSQSNSLRAAYNAVMSLDSLAGFIYLDALKEGKTKATTDSLFRAELAEKNPDYALIRDVAKSYKHIDLTRPASVKRADQTKVGSRHFGAGLFGVGSFGGDEVMIEDNDGEIHHCLSLVVLAFEFLEELRV